MTLGTLFDEFAHTAFRYESLPAYDVGGEEAERLRAWREGRPRPERSVRTSPWLARIAVSTVAGKRWSRVSVLDDPLSDYQLFSLVAYVESQAAGDEMRVIARAHLPPAAAGSPDFWLFDRGFPTARAALMRYTDAGAFLDVDLVTSGAGLDRAEAAAAALVAGSVPLNDFLVVQERARA